MTNKYSDKEIEEVLANWGPGIAHKVNYSKDGISLEQLKEQLKLANMLHQLQTELTQLKDQVIILPHNAEPREGDVVLYENEKNHLEPRECKKWMIELGGVKRIIKRGDQVALQLPPEEKK